MNSLARIDLANPSGHAPMEQLAGSLHALKIEFVSGTKALRRLFLEVSVLVHRTPATPALAGGARESTRDCSASLVRNLRRAAVECFAPGTKFSRVAMERLAEIWPGPREAPEAFAW